MNLSPFPLHFTILSPFHHSLSISSLFQYSLSISSSFPYSLSTSSQPGCKASAGCATLSEMEVAPQRKLLTLLYTAYTAYTTHIAETVVSGIRDTRSSMFLDALASLGSMLESESVSQ